MTPRLLRILGPVLLINAAIVSIVAALAYGGGAAPLALGDPGPFVRWALPMAKMTVNLSAAGIIGPLVLALYALKPEQRAFEIALDTASISAAVFTVSSASTAFLTFVMAYNPVLGFDSSFGEQLGTFLTDTDIGRAWLIATLIGAVVTVLAFAVRGWFGTLIAAMLGIVALVPIATQGHAGDLSNHGLAVSSIALHMLGAAVWIGGLLLIVVVRPILKGRVTDVLERYSSLALAAFVVVAVSGVARAIIGLGSWDELFSEFGVLVIAKTLLLLGMGVCGAVYRRKLIPRTRDPKRSGPFWAVVVGELVLMGLASGIAAALGRTPPPSGLVPSVAKSPAERLTGAPVPPELTGWAWVTQWDVDILWAMAIAFGAFFYLAGVWRLRSRGDAWPVRRTIFWILGLVILTWVTCGPMNAYGDYLFSVHMLGHMLLTMAVPLCLVSGAPVTLALRAIAKRQDGTRGGREWIMWGVHSPFSRIVTHPVVAAGIYVGSLWLFYFSDLLRWAVYDHLGHEWMTLHFLLSGYLFMLTLIGIDPIPKRMPYPGRLVTLIAAAAIHAFFGMALMMHSGLLVAEWYGSLARPWGLSPMEDQFLGAGIAWSIGEIPNLIVAITLAIQWSRSDERQQRQRDRHADRTGDQELVEYNARLARIAERDAREG